MRTEIDASALAAEPPVRAPNHPPPSATARRRRRRGLDWFDAALLAAFAAASVWVLALDLIQAIGHGRVWTGTDGFYIVDQMQYLAWIQDASRHLLSSNLFVLQGTPTDYFQPAIAISGGLTALGIAPWITLLVWKPVAVAAAFWGVRAYARRSFAGLWPRRAVLVLGLFFGSFTLIYGAWGVVGDLFPAFLSWGYTFGLLALAIMLFALLAYDRARSRPLAPGVRTVAWTPALLGALASSLHPWQGELLILIVIAAELTLWHDGRAPRRLVLPVATVVGAGIPLLYYLILGRADLSWHLARSASKHTFPLSTIALGLVPLLVPALLAYRRPARTFMATATRAWPLAALVIYALSASAVSATPLHAFEGVTIPLAVLAVEGVQRLGFARLPRRHVFATAVVAAVTIPATVSMLHDAKKTVAPTSGNANFITHDEHRALRFLAKDREPGGVLTRFYLGVLVPAETGRRTFVGDCVWSEPNCGERAELAQNLLDGSLSDRDARRVVSSSGARFVLADCGTDADMTRALRPLTESVHRFGCATVYVLASPGSSRAVPSSSPVSPSSGTSPLAESSFDAAVRASGRQQRRVESS